MFHVQRFVCLSANEDSPADRPTIAAEGFLCELRLVKQPLGQGLVLPAGAATEEVVPFLFDLVRPEPVEVSGAVYLDGRDHPLGYTMPYRGTTDRVGPEPRHLLVKAWSCRASAMVVFHNHLRGRATPSHADVEWTRGLLALALPLGIEVRDHVILGDEPDFFSMAREESVHGLGRSPEDLWSWREAMQHLDHLERRQAGRRRRRARPKYRDPETGETWAGRGSMAGWLRRRLEAGHELEEFSVLEEDSDAEPPRLD